MLRNGLSRPLGASLIRGGANFSVFSRAAPGTELLLFDREDDRRSAKTIPIDPVINRINRINRTYHYWHVFVPGVRTGQIYGNRAHRPFDRATGYRLDSSKLLLDPYGRAVVVPKHYSREAAWFVGDNAVTAMKSVVVDPYAYDWKGDAPLNLPFSRTIFYELHVRCFTRHPSSCVPEKTRGTTQCTRA
jgi:glycogen operon protein